MSDHSRIDFWAFLFILRQRAALIVCCGVVAAVLAIMFSLVQPVRYEASADLLFERSNLEAAVLGSSPDESQTAPERVAATNLELASLQVVAENARRRLGTSLTVRQLQDRISIQPKGQADIVTITASAPTREEAVRIANTFAEEVVAFRQRAAQEQVQRAIDALTLSQGSDPSVTERGAERLEQLRAIKEVEAGDVTIVQRAVPPREASSPRPLRNTVIGGFLGLLLGVFVALLFHRIDPRVRDSEEIVRIVGAPALARVPDSRQARPGQVFEALQFLRANLQLRDPRRETRVVVVTSPEPGDGKTTIAGGLAEALALAGERVVAIDCDLRDPALHQRLEVEPAAGLTNALLEPGSADDVLVDSPLGPRVMTAGTTALDPLVTVSALARLPDLLSEVRELANYVILDTPPISAAADASTVASIADGVILVVDRVRTRRDALVAAREQLAHARVRVLGVVINRAATAALSTDYARGRAPEQKVEVSP